MFIGERKKLTITFEKTSPVKILAQPEENRYKNIL